MCSVCAQSTPAAFLNRLFMLRDKCAFCNCDFFIALIAEDDINVDICS